MRKTLAAVAVAVTMACGPEVPADDGLDATGRMAWRGSAYATLHLDAPGAPADVAEALRRGVLRQAFDDRRALLVPLVQNGSLTVEVRTGYCRIDVVPESDRVVLNRGPCVMADLLEGDPTHASGTLIAATVTRTAAEIRIATTWAARASSLALAWEGPVSVTYVLTR